MTRPIMMLSRSGGNEGFGLIAALVFILLIAAAVTPLAVVSRTRILSSSYSIRKTAFELMAPEFSKLISLGYRRGALLSPWQRCVRGDRVFYIHYQDQNGLIGLNSASEDLLRVGFLAMGYNDSQAKLLALRALEFREPDFSEAPHNELFRPKRAAFEHIAEIHELLPAAIPMQQTAGQVFSVYNRTDTVMAGHVSSILKQQISKPSNAGFVVQGGSASMFAQITFAEFKAGQSSGFQAKLMLDGSAEDSPVPKIVEKEIGFGNLETLHAPLNGTMPCEALAQRMIGAL